MSRTIFYTASTLDGYLADEQDSLEWLFVQDIDENGPGSHEAFIAGVGAIVMGANTYQWLVDHLAVSGQRWPYSQPTWVFTHRDLERLAASIRFTSEPVAAVHAAMTQAAAGKDVWMVGGGDLAAQFAQAGLLDELRVSIAGVTLGGGKPLFPRRFALRLTTVERNRSFVVAHYDVQGPLD